MKKTILLFALLFQFISYAQIESKWSVGIEYSLDDISISTGNDVIVFNDFSDSYSARFDQTNYTVGFVVNYKPFTKFSFSSGLWYSNKDFTGVLICPACAVANIAPEDIKQRFLTVPLLARYQLSSGKWIPQVEAGVLNNINVKTDLNEATNSIFLQATYGGTLYYQLSEKWKLGGGYRYQTSITNIYKTDHIKYNTSRFFIHILHDL